MVLGVLHFFFFNSV